MSMLCIAMGEAFALQGGIFESDDPVKFVADTEYKFNSNLFMLPNGVNPKGPGSERSDSILTSHIGVQIHKDYGMQHFDFSYAHVNTKFANSTFMDFDADNYQAHWLASITPALTADLLARQESGLRSPEFYGATAPTTSKQLYTTQAKGVVFDFSPNQIGHVYGGYTNRSNTSTGQADADYNQSADELMAGVGYQFSSGTLIKLIYQDLNGTQPLSAYYQIGQNYNQSKTDLSIAWPISGRSNLTASLGYGAKNDEMNAARNYAGLVGSIEYERKFNESSSLDLQYVHRLDVYQTQTISHAEIDALTLSGNWVMTPKFKMKLAITADHRQYPTLPTFTQSVREDNNLHCSLDATWQATEKVKLRTLLERAQRHSNDVDFVYEANLASVYAEINI